MADGKKPIQSSPSKGETIGKLLDAFEAAAHADDDGMQYWLARELAPLLGYQRWENFASAIERAKLACTNSGETIGDHFRDVTKMVTVGSGAERGVSDCELTRFAGYLIALNGDPNKSEIAAAQTYFAVQTRRQEVADQTASQPPALTEDEKRVLLRDEIKGHNKSLASAARAAGVERPLDYAIFKNEGYKGLYGGLDRTGIQRRKKLPQKADILDHMPSGELAANLFLATQTEEKLRRDQIKGKDNANRTHRGVGQKIRQTIADIGGTMPENYEAVPHVKDARKRLKIGKKVLGKPPGGD
ncbi:MAG: DNA damage-inducible protein D [Hyphomicrobium sp.]